MLSGSRWDDLILNVCGCVWLHLFSVYNWDDYEDHFIVRGIEEAGKDG